MIGMLGILAGFAISLGVALFVVPWFEEWLRRDLRDGVTPSGEGISEEAALPREGLSDEATPPREDPSGWKVGTFERAFFTLGIGAGMSGVLTAMILWIVAKMAVRWGARSEDVHDLEAVRFASLLGSLVSMTFALIGGGVVRMGWLMMRY